MASPADLASIQDRWHGDAAALHTPPLGGAAKRGLI
jgi:hypothetical protein